MLENIIKFAAITLDVDSHERQYQPNQETLKTEGMIQLPFEWPDEAISVNTIKEQIKDIQEKIKGHSSELYKLVALLDNYKLNTQIRIICNASIETVNSYNQRCKDISNLLQQFNQLQQNSASIGIIADRFIFYAKSNKDAEQLTVISAYMSAFNNNLKTIKSNLIKVVEPSFLAKLSYALDTENKPLKYLGWIGGLFAFILGMATAITFAILGTYLVAPLVVALVGLIFFTIGGLSTSIESFYLGELLFNNAKDNPHYKSLITAIQEQEVHCSKIKEMNNIFKERNESEKLIEVNSNSLAPPHLPTSPGIASSLVISQPTSLSNQPQIQEKALFPESIAIPQSSPDFYLLTPLTEELVSSSDNKAKAIWVYQHCKIVFLKHHGFIFNDNSPIHTFVQAVREVPLQETGRAITATANQTGKAYEIGIKVFPRFLHGVNVIAAEKAIEQMNQEYGSGVVELIGNIGEKLVKGAKPEFVNHEEITISQAGIDRIIEVEWQKMEFQRYIPVTPQDANFAS